MEIVSGKTAILESTVSEIEGTICLQCGDKGSTNAFVYCVKCLNFAVHRYCLDVIPETFDEIVHWVCGDDCEGEAQNQSAVRNHDAIPSQTRNHIVSKNVKGTREHIVPENVDGFCIVGTKKNDLSVIRKVEHVQKDGPKKLHDTSTKVDLVNCRESAKEDALTQLGIKKDDDHDMLLHEDERKICQLEEKKENNNSNVSPIRACDTKLPNEVKDDKGSEKRDENKCISLKSSKKKKRKTVISSQKILREQNHSTGCGQPLVENKPLKLGNQCAEKSTEENKYIPSKDHIKNGELEDRKERNFANCDKKNLREDFPKDLISSAEPVAMPIWRGSFSIWNEKCGILNGLLAHVSTLACQKVYDEACEFQPVLYLEMLPKSDVWPKSFETSEPRGDNIALYFFPSKSSERDFDRLVDEMIRKELALKAFVQNAELLIFNSSELPLLYWKFQGKYYLWGVFRQKQSSPSNSHPCRVERRANPR